ncbi:MAG: hypothetical protein ACJAUV_001600 [Flavobacteriales bacterium]|jgi:hypothetical protein
MKYKKWTLEEKLKVIASSEEIGVFFTHAKEFAWQRGN